MGKRLFGTDGVRGRAGEYPMLPELALRLGMAAGFLFRKKSGMKRVIVGKDTRISGYIFESALASGLCAAGMNVLQTGPLPTPAIAFLTRNMRADLGIVISASHNPYYDNGIKFFDSKGFKLSDAQEDEIAALALEPAQESLWPETEKLGRISRAHDAPGRYIVSLKNSLPAQINFEAMRVVIDCANGANYKIAPLVLEELGAEVTRIGAAPDGLNINADCGSLHPEKAAAKVLETGADIGLALDGDADRLIVIDEKGRILNGDQILALCALEALRRGALPGRLLVSTVMSNLALELFMKDHGGHLLRTRVGDRYVLEAMLKNGATLGGEQSGHLIFLDHGTSGDGLLAALQVMKIMRESGKRLSELADLLQLYPQERIDVPVKSKIPFEDCPSIRKAVQVAEKELGERGRVLLRYSGTEALARVMIEGENADLVRLLVRDLADTVKENLGKR